MALGLWDLPESWKVPIDTFNYGVICRSKRPYTYFCHSLPDNLLISCIPIDKIYPMLVKLFKVPLEVSGDEYIASYFWVWRPDMTQQIPVRGSEWMGKQWKSGFGTLPNELSLLPLIVVSSL